MQDIVPTPKKSIRQISVDKVIRKPAPGSEQRREDIHPPYREPSAYRRPSMPRAAVWTFSIAGLLVLFFIASLAFSGAAIAVTPKQENVNVSGTYTAVKDDPNGLSYDIISITKEASRSAKATGETEANSKAAGKIIIYNNYSSASQKLIANTRFQTSAGLIFRIADPVTVPGMSTVAGKTAPGSVEVTVTADEAGDKYNIPVSDFTIPGFKGDPRYDKFYARSKAAMTGGASGKIKTVSDADAETARTEMQAELKDTLAKELQNSLPQNALLMPSSVKVSFQDLPNENSADAVMVKEQATLEGVVFDKNTFAAFVAKQGGLDTTGGVVEVLDPATLTATFTLPDNGDLTSLTSIPFQLSGSAHIVWTFNEDQLKEDLAGKSKKDIPSVLVNFPGIEKAKVIMRPPWKQTFPASPKKIDVQIEIEGNSKNQ